MGSFRLRCHRFPDLGFIYIWYLHWLLLRAEPSKALLDHGEYASWMNAVLTAEHLFQIGSLGSLTGLVVIHPRLQSMRWKTLRLSTFVATGLSAFAPIVHAASIFPYAQLDKQAGLRYYYVEGLLILFGVVFYAVRRPFAIILYTFLMRAVVLIARLRPTFQSLGNQGSSIFGVHHIRCSIVLLS